MRINGKNLCIGCMNPLDASGQCSCCHLNQDQYKPIPRCLLPGTVLADRYILGRVLGEGSFGITYIGLDCVLDHRVAIKEYYPSDLVSRDVIRGTDKNVYVYESRAKTEYKENLDKFLNEARCLTRFNQLNGIVSVRDFFYENETAYIVMEYVSGMSVKEYIRENGPMEGERVLELMKPVLETLFQIHRTGMVHRDISPDNILFSGSGELVLIDFGSARMRNMEMTRSMTVVFKRGYSPEEQYRARGRQGAWSDVYAICATMYFMLTGKTPEDAIERMLGAPMKSLTEMPEVELAVWQKKALMKGISVKAEDRYENVGELLAELYAEKEIPDRRPISIRLKFWKISVVVGAVLFILAGCFLWRTLPFGKSYSGKSAVSHEAASVSHEVSPVPMTASPKPVSYKMVKCTDLTKKKAQAVLEKLKEADLSIKWKKAYSNRVPKGHVIRQSIKEGTVWTQGEQKEVILTLSKGPKPVKVPNVCGLTGENAKGQLNKKKLKCRMVWENSQQISGIVIRQSKAAGSKVAKKTTITITVSRGPAATPRPSGKRRNKATEDNDFVGSIS